MIHTKVFCPFERVVTLLSSLSKYWDDVDNVEVTFNSPCYSFNVKNQCGDVNLSVPELVRNDFMRTPEVTGVVVFRKGIQQVSVKKFTVKNVLCTDAIPTINGKYVNGDCSVGDICYPEALRTIANIKPDYKVENYIVEGNVRPFYSYILYSLGDEILILGPKPSSRLKIIGSVDTGDKYPVFIETDEELSLEATPVPDMAVAEVVESVKIPGPFEVILSADGVETPLLFSQLTYAFNGLPIAYYDLYLIYQIVSHCEGEYVRSQFSPSVVDGCLKLTLEKVGDRYYLTKDWHDFYRSVVIFDVTIKPVFDRIKCLDNGIYLLTTSGIPLKLITTSNSACFAYCLAYYVNCISSNLFYGFFKTLIDLFDQGFLVKDNNNIVGDTKKLIKDFKEIELNTFGLYTTGRIKRFDVSSLKEGDIAIAGVDPSSTNKQPGEPDHYVLVRCVGDKYLVFFDPMQNHSLLGHDIRPLMLKDDHLLIKFTGEMLAMDRGGADVSKT